MGTTNRVWILGASDPEMTVIEALLREQGEAVEHAVVLFAVPRRVRPDEANGQRGYVAIGHNDLRGEGLHAICVECRPSLLFGNDVDGIDWAGPVAVGSPHAGDGNRALMEVPCLSV
jgi:hypothetical protein